MVYLLKFSLLKYYIYYTYFILIFVCTYCLHRDAYMEPGFTAFYGQFRGFFKGKFDHRCFLLQASLVTAVKSTPAVQETWETWV